MPKRKKHPRLPNGYGSIRYLGKNRKNPYAVHPPADIDGQRPAALCYVDDWMKGFIVLTAYKAKTYRPGMENTLEIPSAGNTDACIDRILADYSRIRGANVPEEKTFSQVYEAFYAHKFPEGHTLSKSSVGSTKAAYKNCASIHNRVFRELRTKDLQGVMDNCSLKHSSIELIKVLFNQMYAYAIGMDWCDKDYSKYLKIMQPEDDERGIPFTEEELKLLWKNVSDPIIELLVIDCYSGFRISEFLTMQVNLDEQYFLGGSKTKAGKNRIVPIHSSIFPLVKRRIQEYGKILPITVASYRVKLTRSLQSLDILGVPPHTPHDGRHTFSYLAEKYHVAENDRKRMLGHAFSDVTNKVYGHRDIESLRSEIEKIKVNL